MTSASHSISTRITVYEPETDAAYTLDATAELAGVSQRMILVYSKHGLVSPLPGSGPGDWRFDEEAVHTLRRIEQLRAQCGANVSGIKLILDLMNEVDQLRAALRFRR